MTAAAHDDDEGREVASAASPGSAHVEQGWYRVHAPNISFGEMWRLSPSPLTFLLGVLFFKLLRAKATLDTAHWLPVVLEPVDRGSLDEECAATLDEQQRTLAELGLTPLAPYTLRMKTLTPIVGLPFCDDGRPACLELGWVRAGDGTARLQASAWSPLTAGNYLVTTNHPLQLDDPGHDDVERHALLPAEELWRRHVARLEACPADRLAPLGRDDVMSHLERVNARTFAHLLARGVMVPAGADEVAELDARILASP